MSKSHTWSITVWEAHGSDTGSHLSGFGVNQDLGNEVVIDRFRCALDFPEITALLGPEISARVTLPIQSVICGRFLSSTPVPSFLARGMPW
jgi:hypothetical protein